eukprot:4593803-Pyramimonas_sp.AAC.1
MRVSLHNPGVLMRVSLHNPGVRSTPTLTTRRLAVARFRFRFRPCVGFRPQSNGDLECFIQRCKRLRHPEHKGKRDHARRSAPWAGSAGCTQQVTSRLANTNT